MYKYILGIDEAGRGSIAGRVFVGAVLIPFNIKIKDFFINAPDIKPDDSKKLTDKRRREWFLWIVENKIKFSYSATSNKIIDKININNATTLSVKKCIEKISIDSHTRKDTKIISDKGIFLTDDIVKDFGYEKVLHADSVIPAVSLASIVAKVMRDNEMIKISKEYPQYEFDKHKGYGTKKHYESIKKYGLCKLHRLTFLKMCNNIVKS